ncbi:MAG: neutral zinc metallopeptidase, partial [Desulfobacterales bacterium]
MEDRRGVRVTRKAAGGGIGIIVIALIAMYFGIDPSIFLSQQVPTSSVSTQQTTHQIPAAENQLAEFVSVVLADTEDTWNDLFSQMGKTYQEPRLVLFSGAVQSACGFSQAAMGPFYCPADQKVYIDLSFYRDLKNRHGAP